MTRKRTPNRTENVLKAATRIAVQLAREPAGEARTIDEISGDAIAIAKAANRARIAIECQASAASHVSAISSLAQKYHARVVSNSDPDGMVIGLQFAGGTYSCGFANTFFVT